MTVPLSRRQFVAAAAAGVAASSCRAADGAPRPQVLVKPYLQPGPVGPDDTADMRVLCWWTDQVPGDFVVEYELPGGKTRTAAVERLALDFDKAAEPKKAAEPPTTIDVPKVATADLPAEKEQHYYKYVARLTDLPLDAEVRYRVRLGAEVVRAAAFRTRAGGDKAVRIALVGDLANGKEHQNVIAYRIAEERPEILVALGDLAYPAGRVSQYMHFFWKTYNDAEAAGPTRGAPLMATTTVYPLLGNHDVAAKPAAVPDALGAYYFFHVPQTGPGVGPWVTPLSSDKAAAARFRAATADSYPGLDAYSFDHGPAHFVVLNSNQSGNVDQPALRQWVEKDLTAAAARWKFVCYHNPAFSSSHQHYTEQSVRGWHPLFEQCGVDVVFCGHVHNYQRTKPLRFAPPSAKRDKRGRLDGEFTIDETFDGAENTRPQGIVHVVAGGGGATLYGPGLDKTAATLRAEHGDNYADFTARMIVDRHTFVMLDLTPEEFQLRAVDLHGKVVDAVAIRKPLPA